jgi:hypothetical protein
MHISLHLTLIPAIYLLFQSSLTAADTPEITARRLTERVHVDGILNEPAWKDNAIRHASAAREPETGFKEMTSWPSGFSARFPYRDFSGKPGEIALFRVHYMATERTTAQRTCGLSQVGKIYFGVFRTLTLLPDFCFKALPLRSL